MRTEQSQLCKQMVVKISSSGFYTLTVEKLTSVYFNAELSCTGRHCGVSHLSFDLLSEFFVILLLVLVTKTISSFESDATVNLLVDDKGMWIP